MPTCMWLKLGGKARTIKMANKPNFSEYWIQNSKISWISRVAYIVCLVSNALKKHGKPASSKYEIRSFQPKKTQPQHKTENFLRWLQPICGQDAMRPEYLQRRNRHQESNLKNSNLKSIFYHHFRLQCGSYVLTLYKCNGSANQAPPTMCGSSEVVFFGFFECLTYQFSICLVHQQGIYANCYHHWKTNPKTKNQAYLARGMKRLINCRVF